MPVALGIDSNIVPSISITSFAIFKLFYPLFRLNIGTRSVPYTILFAKSLNASILTRIQPNKLRNVNVCLFKTYTLIGFIRTCKS